MLRCQLGMLRAAYPGPAAVDSMVQELATPAAAALPAASSLKQRPTVANIQAVQLAIERCLSVYMSQAQVVDLLHTYAKVEPAFTTLVWNKLAENNPAFFEAYELQVRLKGQVLLFNQLLEQQRAVMAMLHHAWQQSAAAARPGQVLSEGTQGPGVPTGSFTTQQRQSCAGGEQTPLTAPVVPPSSAAAAGAAAAGGGGAAAGAAAAVHHHQGHTLPAAGTGGGRGGAVGVVAAPSAAHTPQQSRPTEPWPATPAAAAGVSGGQARVAASPAAWDQRQLPYGQQQQGAVQQFQQLQELAHQQQQTQQQHEWAQQQQQQQPQEQQLQGWAPRDNQGLPQQQQQQDWAQQQQQQGWAPHDLPQQQQQQQHEPWEQRWSSSGAPCSMEQSAGNGCAGLGGGAAASQQAKGAGSVIHSPAISSVQGDRDRSVSGSGSGGTYSPTPAAAAAAGAAGAGRTMTGRPTLEEMLAPAADVDVSLEQQGLLDLPPPDDVVCMLEEWQ